eukprot:8729136-Pyramimonas_sp.AAC.1
MLIVKSRGRLIRLLCNTNNGRLIHAKAASKRFYLPVDARGESVAGPAFDVSLGQELRVIDRVLLAWRKGQTKKERRIDAWIGDGGQESDRMRKAGWRTTGGRVDNAGPRSQNDQ